jgi:hypothetical protein
MTGRSEPACGVATRHLRNARILVKSLVAPLIGVLITAAIVAVAAMQFVAFQAATDRAELISRLDVQADRAALDMTVVHAMLYRTITHKAQGVELSIVRQVRDEAAATLADAETAFHGSISVDLPFDEALMERALLAFDGYLAVAKMTMDLVDIDGFTAMVIMQTAEPKYGDARAAIDGLTRALTLAHLDLEAAAQQFFLRASSTIDAGTLVGVILALGCAVFFAHLISHPVTVMTEVMTRLAGGDHSVEIPATQIGMRPAPLKPI